MRAMEILMNGNIIIGAGLGQAIGDYIGFQVENESGERAHAFGLKMFEPNMTFAGVPQSLRPLTRSVRSVTTHR